MQAVAGGLNWKTVPQPAELSTGRSPGVTKRIVTGIRSDRVARSAKAVVKEGRT